TALLLGLVALAPAGARLIVAHAEHDLRTAAADDREFVAALAARLGLECTVTRLAVRRRDAAGGEGLEARARRLRYRFLEEVSRDHAARHVLVAHTADDQAETILHRILRGTGPAGLAGISPARTLCEGVALLRPLLAVPRDDVRAFLTAEAEAWREDESNADVRHARNFLRHEILARCAAGPYPAVAAALVRLGSQAGRLAAALRSAADHLLALHARRHADGTIVLRTEGLVGLDPHLRAEVFAALWEQQGWPRRDMTAGHYERLATMAVASATSAAAAADFPGGVRVVVERAGAIVVVPPAQ
ncbi:MAG: tRNA lysidine(34) synthetase TilS, partial [Planctomycetia bacterium]